MLTNILAIVVGLASFMLYATAFIMPKLHRKDDFFWGSVGLFYALDLWICRESFRGGVLLGQLAACALLLSLGWQMWRLRILSPEKQDFSLLTWMQVSLFPPKQPIPTSPVEKVKDTEENQEISSLPAKESESKVQSESSTIEKPTKQKKGFLSGIFGKKKVSKTPPSIDKKIDNKKEETTEKDFILEEITETSVEQEPQAISQQTTEETTEKDFVLEEIVETSVEEIITVDLQEPGTDAFDSADETLAESREETIFPQSTETSPEKIQAEEAN